MSKEAREFLVDNGCMDSTGYTSCDLDFLPDMLEEYFAFRLGKLLLDGDIKRCDDGDNRRILPNPIDTPEYFKDGLPVTYKQDDYKVCETCGEDV